MNSTCVFCFQIFVTAFLGFMPCLAADFYVDPLTGSMQNDGSYDSPWRTLEEVIDLNLVASQAWESHPYSPDLSLVPKNEGAPVQAGDIIYLRNGYHGVVSLIEYYNAAPITITNQAGHSPQLARLQIRSAQNWSISGLTLSPELAPVYETATLIDLDSHSWTGPIWDCQVQDCFAYSVIDSSSWTLQNWNDLACNGISLDGDRLSAQSNRLLNVNFGITASGEHCQVVDNTVENFAGDGLRGLGDFGTFEGNLIKNCYDVNGNHDDGFQSWSNGPSGVGSGTVYGIVIRGNTFINYEDPNQPFRGTLQGIGCFDGFFEDWVIENNVVMVDHWHGITLMGARNCRIVNNTVIDLNAENPGPPWIRITAHKDGTPSSGCTVRNNLASSYNSDSTGVTEDHNVQIAFSAYESEFIDVTQGNLRLLAGSSAVDMGSPDLAPLVDQDGVDRPQLAAWDCGAFEYRLCDNFYFFLGGWPHPNNLLVLLLNYDCEDPTL